MNFILLLSLYASFGICISSGVCSKQASHYEQHSTGCKKCPTGFFSAVESLCVPCAGGAFGKRCADVCACQPDQRCDNVKGCMMSINTSSLSSDYSSDIGANWTSISNSNSTNGTVRQAKIDGMRIRAVVIYIICTTSITLTVTVAVFLLINRSKRNFKKKMKGKRQSRQSCSNEQYTTIL
ncbi:uncharacterized protein LOC127706879 isoform X2 [Mytilus californianus]|uniref:uncharacterized protein LOC127706879 isoform X2 n=1 Tax=Mytilus californianus TaxID=6549 RepID=UPI00224857D0|nr:uncharacterized protein LOC127706879 isoform X2 [Mytilus californianus]